MPLWVRLGLTFGGLVGLLVAGSGVLSFRRDLARRAEERRDRLEALAATLAVAIDAEEHAALRTRADLARPAWRRTARLLRAAREAHDVAWVGTSAMDPDGHFHVVVDGGRPPPLPPGFPIFDGLEERRAVWAGRPLFVPALEDEWGTWTVAMAPIAAADGRVVGIVEVMEDAERIELFARERAAWVLLQILLGVVGSMGGAVLVARAMGRPLRELTAAVLEVARTGRGREVEVCSHDEIGALATAFNEMLRGLREREFLRDTFGRFVSEDVAREVLARRDGLRLGGEARTVTVLMSDLRGFTAMAEDWGPERTVEVLNRYLSAMTDVVLAHGGNLSEMLGDGLLVLFGAPVRRDDDALRAVRCAVEMQRALVRFNAEQGLRLQMGIGVATGIAIVGHIGSERRMKYGAVGATVNRAARLEHVALGGQVLLDADTLEAVRPHVEVASPVVVRVKGMAGPLLCWPLRAVLGADPLAVPGSTTMERARLVDLPATCTPVRGKALSDERLEARVAMIAPSALLLRAAWRAEPTDAIAVTIHAPDGDIPDIFARVAAVHEVAEGGATHELELRVTSMPEASRAGLDRLLEEGDGR